MTTEEESSMIGAAFKLAARRKTKALLEPIEIRTEVEPAFFEQFVEDLAKIRRRPRGTNYGIDGYFKLRIEEGDFLRWCWGNRKQDGAPVDPSWVCVLELWTSNTQTGLRKGRLSTPGWKERAGERCEADEWKVSRDTLLDRLREADARFTVVERPPGS